MTIEDVNVSSLKRMKNNVIGNPSAKLALAQNEGAIQTLVGYLNPPPSRLEIQGSQDSFRIEAAHVISSISYGSQEALGSLLRANALQAFLYAISHFQSKDSTSLKAAFARALRALAVAISETVGPSQWGLQSGQSDVRYEASEALDYLFQLDCLDIYLPLLINTSPQTSTSIAQLLASSVRTAENRAVVTDWLPPADRIKEVKGKRGWEKPETIHSNAPGRQGGWVARNLIVLLKSRDMKCGPAIKLQEAALSALAALAQDNSQVAAVLAKAPEQDMPPPLSTVMALSKTRSTDVQLAASLCATHIIRANANNHSLMLDPSSAPSIIHVVNRMISSSDDSRSTRTKACFILCYLVSDDPALCQNANDRGSLEKLADLVKLITPLGKPSEWDEDEPESISCLREAALRAIAALCLFEHQPRREVADNLQLMPIIHASLSHRHVGVRFAACQCVRMLSRAVAVIRTNVIDSGLGLAVFGIFKKEGEDRHVTNAALAAVCNIVTDFSPLRPLFIEQGGVARLVQLLNTDEPEFRLSSMWAVKNLLRKTTNEEKQSIMGQLGWSSLARLFADPDEKIQEQAFYVVRNLAEDEFGIDLVFQELGSDVLLNSMISALESPYEEVVLQAAYAIANFANGYDSHQDLIISNPRLLLSLRSCMSDAKVEVRRPAVSCVSALICANPKRRQEFQEAGIISTLRHMCDWSGGVSLSPGGRMSGHHHVIEDDKEVIGRARQAVEWLDHWHGADS